jgi:predicted amidohydrolase
MKIGLIQYNPTWEDKDANKKRIKSLLKDANGGVDLLIFPEMTLTGFSMRSETFAEEIEGESFKYFATLAENFECDVVAGVIEKKSAKYFNTIIHIEKNGKLKTHYHKIHPFSFSDEDKHFSAGNKPVITGIYNWKIGLSICYDLRFPELYRFYSKEKVDLIIVIANWPDTRIEHWRTLLKARAIENQCYVAGVNRVGKDPKLNYTGFSSVFDPMGKEIIAVENEEKFIVAEIDKSEVEKVRSQLPFLEDMKLI